MQLQNLYMLFHLYLRNVRSELDLNNSEFENLYWKIKVCQCCFKSII